MKGCFSVNNIAISHYLRDLRSLNRVLLSEEAYSADTLCPVMLLGVYEVRLASVLLPPYQSHLADSELQAHIQ
jgi:hypothetical protein